MCRRHLVSASQAARIIGMSHQTGPEKDILSFLTRLWPPHNQGGGQSGVNVRTRHGGCGGMLGTAEGALRSEKAKPSPALRSV